MKRKFRLIKSTDFKRVRRLGKPYAHPFLVLIKLPNNLIKTRVGVSAGRSIGNAVRRNKAKRKIREIIRTLLPEIQPGWDIIILARKPILTANQQEIKSAMNGTLLRSDLFRNNNTEE